MMSAYCIWDRYMRGYDFLTKVDSYSRNLKDIADALDVRQGMRVLDAGSGTGNLSMLLKARGGEVISCDFSANALARHREKDPKAVLVLASLENPLPLDAAAFDAVCCASVLFALSEGGCKRALSEFHRVLRPGGKLVATVPAPDQRNGNLVGMHFRGLAQRHGLAQGWLRGVCDLPDLARIMYYNRQLGRLPDWHGFHRFSEAELREFLSEAGFADVCISRTYGGRFLLAAGQKRTVIMGTAKTAPRTAPARPVGHRAGDRAGAEDVEGARGQCVRQ